MSEYFVIEPCKTSNAIEIKLKNRTINMQKAGRAFSSLGAIAANTPVVLLAKVRQYNISVYASGRLMVKGESRLDTGDVRRLAREMLDALEKESAISERGR